MTDEDRMKSRAYYGAENEEVELASKVESEIIVKE